MKGGDNLRKISLSNFKIIRTIFRTCAIVRSTNCVSYILLKRKVGKIKYLIRTYYHTSLEPIRYDKSAECKTGCDSIECDILLSDPMENKFD